jgi:hypothetical protein
MICCQAPRAFYNRYTPRSRHSEPEAKNPDYAHITSTARAFWPRGLNNCNGEDFTADQKRTDMKSPKWKQWRSIFGPLGSAIALVLFACAYWMYGRYADPDQPHTAERLQHATLLGHLWMCTFYGAMATFIFSVLGRGWARWSGIVLSGASFLWSMMTLGAMCGPFNC